MGDLPEPDGGSSPSTSSFSSNPNPTTIGPGRWLRAEKATQKIIRKVQPTLVSDQRRREVIDYVQRLFRNYLSCEVFPYGSVPLKTYLPDGDIDLTAFGGASAEDTLANGMVSILEGEDQSRAADFVVKDIQLIRAEVDCLIGKEHLFKRSIILIKAWCYYESRILGAHHGLISTYALETLVLYIFHLFHLTLNGPLQVLYKFLDYFSKFDWENYCVSLSGPIRLSSLPDLVAEIPDNGGSDLLLSSEFLRYCTDMFSVPSRGTDSNSRTFQPKHLNIVDPLKENNNLGRSVSKGNFYRIRSAFTYGARKLGRILLQPEDEITDGISKYFFNTLDRHGNRQRPDVQVAHPVYAHGGYNPELSICETNSCAVDRVNLDSNSDSSGSSHDVIASGLEINCNSKNEAEEGTVGVLLSKLSVGGEHHETGNALDCRFIGDARDLATYRVESLTMPIDLPKHSELSSVNKVSPAGTLYHAPHFYVSNSAFSSGEKTYENSDLTPLTKFPKDDHTGALCDSNGSINRFGLDENQTVGNGDVVLGRVKDERLNLKVVSDSENLRHDSWDQTSRIPDVSSPLSDLSGDYENQLKCLQLGRWHYEYSSNVQALPRHPGPPSVFQGKNSRDALHYSSQFKQNGFSHRMGNGVIPNPAFYAVSPVIIPAMAFGLEDMPKPRGTGTYFPILKRLPQGHRPSAVKGRSHAHASLRSPRNAVRNSMFTETNSADQTSAELSHESVSGDQSGTNLGPSNVNHSFTSQEKGHPSSNGLVLQPDGGFEFGSVENVPAEMNQLDRGRHWQHRGLSSPENASPVSPTRASRMLKPVATRDQDRVSVESAYRLKDEDDFPPLSF